MNMMVLQCLLALLLLPLDLAAAAASTAATTALPRGMLDVTASPYNVDNTGATDVTWKLQVHVACGQWPVAT